MKWEILPHGTQLMLCGQRVGYVKKWRDRPNMRYQACFMQGEKRAFDTSNEATAWLWLQVSTWAQEIADEVSNDDGR